MLMWGRPPSAVRPRKARLPLARPQTLKRTGLTRPVWQGEATPPLTSRRNALDFNIAADELHNVVHRRSRLEDRRHTRLLQPSDVLIRNNPAHQHDHILHLVLLEQIHHARHDGIVRP